jgi:hypothetical protein
MGQKGNRRTSQFGHDPCPLDVPIGIRLLVYGSNRKEQNYRLNSSDDYKPSRESQVGFLNLNVVWILCSVGLLGERHSLV